MIYRFLLPFIILITLCYRYSAHAQDDWDLIKNSEGIKVYSKTSDNNENVEIKAVSSLKGELKTFHKIMNDVPNYKKWMHAAEETTLLKRKNSSEFTYYMHSDFPWPAKDRDIVIKTVLHYKPENGEVYTVSKSVNGLIGKKDGINRIRDMEASWHFSEEGNEKVKVTYYGKITPSIQLPDWLAKIVYNTGPYNTIKNMREYIRKNSF